MENQHKIRTNATLYRVLLRSFCIIVLFLLLTGAYGLHQSRSKTALKNKRTFTHLNTAPFLEQKRRKDSRKPRLRYDTRGLVGTSRFWLNKPVIHRPILSRLLSRRLSCPLFRKAKNKQDKSCIVLTITIARIYSVSEVGTSLFLSRHKKNNVNKGLMSVLKRVMLRAELLAGPSWKITPIAVNEGAQKANFLQENQCPVLLKIRSRRSGPWMGSGLNGFA